MESIRFPNKTVIRITPKVGDLLPYKRISCTECDQVFTNIGNLQMHLTRHHKKKLASEIDSLNQNLVKIFYCPIDNCIYNEKIKCGGRYFTNIKYIRQHFQKVHVEKTFKCGKCDRKFSTIGVCATHELNCGRIYQCSNCDCNYSTREALLTHVKRKQHQPLVEQPSSNIKLLLPPLKRKIVPEEKSVDVEEHREPSAEIPYIYMIKVAIEAKDQITQTELDLRNHRNLNNEILPNFDLENLEFTKEEVIHTNNEFSPAENLAYYQEIVSEPVENQVNFVKSGDYMNYPVSEPDINQTQTKFRDQTQNAPSVQNDIQNYLDGDFFEDGYFEELASHFCHIETQTEFPSDHMHTQTCDDFFTELGLADIQTQTNWSALDECERKVAAVQCSSISGPHDELLVSTETQTSFTQCLLECNSRKQSNDNGVTQHTQTCDLDELFGESNSRNQFSFQSAYTQT